MTTHRIFVENTGCNGCINSVKTALLKLRGVTPVEIFKHGGKVYVNGIAVEKKMVPAILSSLGYPQKGNGAVPAE